MKKLTSFLILIAMLLTLCACGSPAPSAPSATPAPEPVEAPAAVAETAEAEEDVSFSQGTVSGSYYENTSLNIHCTLGDEWIIADDEQLAEIMGIVAEAITDESLSEQIENGGSVCDFYAVSGDDYSTVNIQVSKFGNALSVVQASLMSPEKLRDETYDQFIASGSDKIIFDSLGLSDASMEKGTTAFAGQDNYPCIVVHGIMDINGTEVDFYETLIVFTKGKYLGNLTAASYFEDTTGAILLNFGRD